MNRAETPVEFAQPYRGLELIDHPVWIFDIDRCRVHWANSAAMQVWGADSLEELRSRDMRGSKSDSVARRLEQYQSDFTAHGAVFTERWTLYPGGKPTSLNVSLRGHQIDEARVGMFCEGQVVSVESPESLRSVEALLHTAVMISLYGRDGQPLYRNPAARASVQSLNQPLEERVVDAAALAAMMASIDAGGMATQTLAVHTTEGERWHEISMRHCSDAVTGQDAVLVSEADVSAIKHTEARARFLSLHDSLTGLPNRDHVMKRFKQAVNNIRVSSLQAALMFIDLDHFKDINDTLGHAAGDSLLIEVADRLRRAVRGGDLVARLGGDEFLILMVSDDIRSEVDRVRERLMHAVAQPFDLGGREIRVTPSLGVSLYPDDGDDIETLLRNADLAMYTAKARGRNGLAYYDVAMSDAIVTRTDLEAQLHQAVERREFEVFYQPILDVSSERIAGVEALVRWRHPQRGLVEPDVFIGLCESTGLIDAVGNFVFETAARQQAAWQRAGHPLRVAVNLSARQLRNKELLPQMQLVLGETQADAQRMQLEITESMLLGHDDALMALLKAIESTGMSIALDDFGTGYSNLAYLHRFPISTLKIDKTFIQSTDPNRPLAKLIVSMAHLMNLGVVAEGVETAEQFDWVRAHGVARCQGYFFARPMPASELTAMLESGPGCAESANSN